MTIFGIRIMRESTFREYEAHCVRLMEIAEKDIETLKAKYQYAKVERGLTGVEKVRAVRQKHNQAKLQ